MVSTALTVGLLGPMSAVIVVATVRDGNVVVTLNVTDVWPAGMVTVGGTVQNGAPVAPESLLSVTTTPPTGAGFSRVTRPTDEAPPITLFGVSVSDTKVGIGGVTVTVRAAVMLLGTAPMVARTVTFVLAMTVFDVAVNVAVRLGLVIRTVDGTVRAFVLLEVKLTVRLVFGASFSVMVPIEFC